MSHLATDRASRVVDGLHRAARRADQRGFGRRIAAVWAVAKLAAAAPLAPLIAAAVLWRAGVNNRRAASDSRTYPSRVAALSGTAPRIATELLALDARCNIVITSDIHRTADASTSWPTLSNSDAVYQAMLDRFGPAGWTLIENGDIDDFWIVGGSSWGVAYDLLRGAAWLADRAGGHGWSNAVAARHAKEIRRQHQTTYEAIGRHFANGRYIRTTGNHDDVGDHDGPRTVITHSIPGASVTRNVLLVGGGDLPSAVVNHGHDTDAWNSPGRAGLGRLSTWFATSVNDLPFGPKASSPPGTLIAERVANGDWPNEVLRVDPVFGANRHHDSMDEDLLAAAFAAEPAEEWLIFGHTHSPVLEPFRPDGTRWERYANSGAAMFGGLVTAIEWHGRPTSGAPRIELTAYRFVEGELDRTVLQSTPLTVSGRTADESTDRVSTRPAEQRTEALRA